MNSTFFIFLLDVSLLFESSKIMHNPTYTIIRNLEKILFCNLFVTSKNEFSNSPIYEFKVLQNVFKVKKQGLKFFFKVINEN